MKCWTDCINIPYILSIKSKKYDCAMFQERIRTEMDKFIYFLVLELERKNLSSGIWRIRRMS